MRTFTFSLLLVAASLSFARAAGVSSAELAPTIQLLEFLAGQPFTPAEHMAITRDEATLLQREPSRQQAIMRQNATTLHTLLALRNPVAQAERRQQLYTGVYWSNRSQPDVGFTIMLRHRPVLVADPQSKNLVTSDAVDALYDNNDFVARLAGFAPYTAVERQALRKQLLTSFLSFTAESQRRVQYALTYRLAMTRAWADGDAKLRAAMQTYAKSQVRSRAGVAVGASRFELVSYRAWVPQKGASVAELSAENAEINRLGLLANQLTILSPH